MIDEKNLFHRPVKKMDMTYGNLRKIVIVWAMIIQMEVFKED